MENILDIYEMPYNPEVPVVCMDEKPYQLLGETREPLPMRLGDTRKVDSEYVRNGACSIFVFVESLGGVRYVSVREHRTAVDWAEEIRYLVDVSYPDRDKIILVMENLNTHALSSLYKAFPAPEARRITKKLEIRYTPKHGSWRHVRATAMNIQPVINFPGASTQTSQECLPPASQERGILPNLATLGTSLHDASIGEYPPMIQWQFTTDNARTKLISLYPKFDKVEKINLAKYKSVSTLKTDVK